MKVKKPTPVHGMTRRKALASGLLAGGLFAFGAEAQTSVIRPGPLDAGQFVWMPELSPRGAVAVVISLPDQLVHVYRGGVRIGVSTCSTGKPGKRTPTGVFTILEKDRDHYSNLYNNAPMPNMDRLTWTGIAIHAGHLPGYPASHGCIRLPREFSDALYEITQIGTPVIIAGDDSDPWSLRQPNLVLTNTQIDSFSAAVNDLKRQPSDWRDARTNPVMTLIASSADRRLQLLQNGRVIDESELTIFGSPMLGEQVLMIDQTPDGRMGWATLVEDRKTGQAAFVSALRIRGSEGFTQRLIPRQQVGMMLIITDYALTPDMRSADNFRIMTS